MPCQVRPNGKRASYKLTSTIMLRIATDHSTDKTSSGEMRLSGSMTRQQEQELPAPDENAHLPNMGRMIESMENSIRDSLKECVALALSICQSPLGHPAHPCYALPAPLALLLLTQRCRSFPNRSCAAVSTLGRPSRR